MTALQREWLKHQGKLVTIDGQTCKLIVRATCARYPWPSTLRVGAEPLDKTTAWYKRMRRNSRKPWTLDILDTHAETRRSIQEQVNWQYDRP